MFVFSFLCCTAMAVASRPVAGSMVHFFTFSFPCHSTSYVVHVYIPQSAIQPLTVAILWGNLVDMLQGYVVFHVSILVSQYRTFSN